MDTQTTDEAPAPVKNPAAQAMARLRAASLTREQRVAIATKASHAAKDARARRKAGR